MALARPTLDVGRVENRTVPGSGVYVPVRLYWPQAANPGTPLAAIVYVHGGGYVVGDLDTHDAIMREICVRAGMFICSVDYRLAPEHKFPMGLLDICAAVRWIAANADTLGVDRKRIGIAGESAGGNMAAGVVVAALDDPTLPIAGQFLFYPNTCTLQDFTTPSRTRLGDDGGFIPTRAQIEGVIQHYTRSAQDRRSPLVSPLLKEDPKGMPPTLIVTAAYDPLCDDGRLYAEHLKAAGVQVEYRCLETTIHGFLNFGKALDISQEAFDYFAAKAKEILLA
ncbi:MAG: alpha/beta hydrolase [Sinimarinibacterium sp.]